MEILTGIISKIIEYTVEPVGRQMGYLINYKSNLESLRSQLKNLDAAKDRMKHRVDEVERNGKGVETDVQNWRKEADGITQEAEKILGNEGQAKTKCFRGVCPNLVSYHQFSRKSAKLAKKIEPHAKKEFPSVSYEAPVEDICAIPSQEYMAFESRTSMLKQIMEELKNHDTNMIGVYGLGGVGKTTLAKEVFRQVNKEEKLFDDVVIILNVKEKKDMEIQKEIAEKLGMEVKEPQSMAVRANCLWRRIEDKKTLVILDDVLGRIDLEAVGLVRVRTCNLLLTSRDKEVLFSEMGTQKNFQLDLLCEQESLTLFEKRAGAVIQDDRIQRVANELAKKCGGLPILVVAVASGLRESSLEEWKDTLRRFKSFEKKGLAEIAFLIIEWSYNQLDSEELRPLFLLCGIMSECNSGFFFSDLLKYTIGLGLFKNVRTVEEARNAVHSLVKKLKDSCLLLDGYKDGSVRMHDVVRDVAVRIASRDQHVLSRAHTELDESPSKDCSLISLRHCTIPKLPDVPWECPELKYFYLGSCDNSLEIPGNFFEEMKELRVLDLTQLHFPSLPRSLQSLTNLQTLCLDQCKLGDIALVGHLTNLKVLSLLKSEVKELPKEIGQLTRLLLLDLTGCSELVLISPGVISSLTSLEDLRMGSFKEWEGDLNDGRSNASVSELKQLRQLTALDIHIPDAKLLPANMFSDTRLERYTIIIGDCWLYPDNYETSSNMLKLKLTTKSQFDQGIKLLLKRCEHLDLDGMEAANIISYILTSDSSKQLKNLHVQNNTHAFPILESLSLDNLVNLTLWNLPNLIGFSSKGSRPVVTTEDEEIISENEIGGPTKLSMNGEVLMPNLTRLILHKCDGLRFLFSFSMARSLVQLTHLEIASCQIMGEIVTKMGSSEENTDNIFRKLKHLQLQHLPSLTRFCSGSYVEFPSLKLLHLEDCSELGVFIFLSKSENITVGKQTEERDIKDYIETDVQYFLLDEKVGFPSLESLIIRDMPKLRTIWHCQLDPDSFRKLKLVEVLRCHNLINIFASSMMGRLNALGTLVIKHCKSLEVVFNVKEAYGTSRTQLKTFGCPNLELAIMDSCESLKNIFPVSVAKGLQQLRELIVWNCGILEEIVANEGAETTPIEEFVFPNVTTLIFWTLPQLRSFYPGLHVSKWPLLKENDDRNFKENLETVIPHFLFDEKVGFPSLERLTIWGLPKLMTIWHDRLAPNSFCKLREVEVSRCDTLINIFVPSMMGRLNALHTLRIKQCKSLQLVFGVKEAYATSRTLLETFGCPNLDLVVMDSCDSLKNIFTASVAKGLQQLRELSVENCGILEEIVAKEGVETTPTEEFEFPNVTLAKFEYLPQLRSFYPGLHVSKWPLLEDLRFFECGKVEIFASEYSRFQERLNSGLVCTPIKQPFLLVDKDNPFPNLKKLGLDENKDIWYEAHGPLPAELFRNLKILRFSCVHPNSFAFVQKLHGLEELIVIGGPWKEIFVYEGISSGEIDAVGRTFQHIKNLGLIRMQELMHLGNDDCKSIFPNLEILKVWECGRLKNLTSSAISFRNLTSLDVGRCEGLKYLTTYSVAKCLHQLKGLQVVDCKSMIEIVASNGDEQDSGNDYEIAFSSLQHLKLSDLPILRGFCSSEIFTIRVPSLNTLTVEKCLIELQISPDKSLIQSSSRLERQQITEEVEEKRRRR